MKIKVLHITKMKGISGSENHLLTLLAGLDKATFEVHLCILAESCHLSLLQDYKKTLEQAGVVVFILIVHKYVNVSLLWTLRQYIIRGQFQLVHTHLIHADLYGTLAAKLAGVSTIISSRHNDDRFRHHMVLIWVNRFLAQWHSKIIVISDWIGRFLQEVEGISPDKIVRIHYGLQPEPIAAAVDRQYVHQQFQISKHFPIIGTIGRLTVQKGHIYFLRAIQQVRDHFPKIRVCIIGDGELRSKLEKVSKELGLEANVIFTGYREDAIKLLSGFDFFVFPSLWEGFGLVLLEAMAMKKAIIASEVSAIPETVIHGKTGLLVPPKNFEKLAEAIMKLLHDKALCRSMGEAGHKRLQQHFSVQKMVDATEKLYLDVQGF